MRRLREREMVGTGVIDIMGGKTDVFASGANSKTLRASASSINAIEQRFAAAIAAAAIGSGFAIDETLAEHIRVAHRAPPLVQLPDLESGSSS